MLYGLLVVRPACGQDHSPGHFTLINDSHHESERELGRRSTLLHRSAKEAKGQCNKRSHIQND